MKAYSTHIARWYYHIAPSSCAALEMTFGCKLNWTLKMTNTQYSVFGEIWHKIITVGMDNTIIIIMVTIHTRIYIHSQVYTYTTLTDVHMHMYAHTAHPWESMVLWFTCGLNVPEEDTYSYNHSKKVHSTSRASFDTQIIPRIYNNIMLLVHYDSMYEKLYYSIRTITTYMHTLVQ